MCLGKTPDVPQPNIKEPPSPPPAPQKTAKTVKKSKRATTTDKNKDLTLDDLIIPLEPVGGSSKGGANIPK